MKLPEVGTTFTCTCSNRCPGRYGIVTDVDEDDIFFIGTVNGKCWDRGCFSVSSWWESGLGRPAEWPEHILTSYTKAVLLGEIVGQNV
jgi:hypothetical protein